MGKKVEGVGALLAVGGIIGAVASQAPMANVTSLMVVFLGFVVFVVGRFL